MWLGPPPSHVAAGNKDNYSIALIPARVQLTLGVLLRCLLAGSIGSSTSISTLCMERFLEDLFRPEVEGFTNGILTINCCDRVSIDTCL